MPHAGFAVSRDGVATVVSLRKGSLLDAAEIDDIARDLRGVVDHNATVNLIIDFGEVDFLGSRMLDVLVSLDGQVTVRGGRLVLCGFRPEIAEILRITHLDKHLSLARDENEAMRMLGEART